MTSLLTWGFESGEYERLLGGLTFAVPAKVVAADDERALLGTARELNAAVMIVYWRKDPGAADLELLRRLQEAKLATIVVTATEAGAEAKIAALEAGAVDCVDAALGRARVQLLVDLFLERQKVYEQHVTEQTRKLNAEGLVFQSELIQNLLSQLTRVSSLNSTILLTGETGVGKTTLARWVHNQSSRRDEPFLDVACAALPSTLIESELFGHVRGAFTSADRDQRGKLRAAGCGTLLLDEVDCLPIDVQAKLLRAVEQRLFEPVGSSKSEKLLARLVVASNRPLDQEVAAGRFRSDLYYRLSVLEFRVPPLRERLDAVLSMAEAFVRQFAASHGRSVTGISVAASQALLDYSWPGNIRELRNAMDHAVALSTGSQLQWSDLPEAVRRGGAAAAVAVTAGHASPALPLASQPAGPLVAGSQVSGAGCLESSELSGATARLAGGNQLQAIREKAERDLLLATLARNNNNRSKTAAELGISRVTLYKRLERLGIGPGPLDQMAAGGIS